MNIIEAIKSGRPFKQPLDKVWWNPLVPSEFYNLTREEILSDTWEIQERKVEITARQFLEACDEVLTQLYDRRIAREPFNWEILHGLLEKLGLKEEPK